MILSERIRLYQELSKSGIVALVLISVFGGYLIGHPHEFPLRVGHLALTLLGILLLASGSSALNQYQERTIDARMPRTSKRPLPSGRVSEKSVVVFIFLTLIGGLGILGMLSLRLLILGAIAVFSYNLLYTVWWKRRWAYAAIPGAVPGALPILMGHASASGNSLTAGGIYLFSILFFWQMPHFWVLALKFRSDYAKGGIPTLPVAHGEGITLKHIVLWCLAYVGIAQMAPLFLKIGAIYSVISVLTSLKILWELRRFIIQPQDKTWLRFFLWVNFSLILYIAAAVVDIWGVYLVPWLTR